MFRIEFTDRSFRLGARTSREFEEWIRIFNLIDKMNKMGHSITDKNPYVFEDQQKNFKKTNAEIADLAVDVHNLRDIPDDYRPAYHNNSNRKSKHITEEEKQNILKKEHLYSSEKLLEPPPYENYMSREYATVSPMPMYKNKGNFRQRDIGLLQPPMSTDLDN